MSTQELYPELFSAPRELMWSAVDFVDSLPHIDISDLDEDDRRCAHCLNQYGETDEEVIDKKKDWRHILQDFQELPFCRSTSCNDPVRLPCGHVLGLTCLVDVFQKFSPMCPLCRRNYDMNAQLKLNEAFFLSLKPRHIRDYSWVDLRLCFHKLVIAPETMKEDWEATWDAEVLRRSKGHQARIQTFKDQATRATFEGIEKFAWLLPNKNKLRTPAFTRRIVDYVLAKARKKSKVDSLISQCIRISITTLCRVHALRQTFETVCQTVKFEQLHSVDGRRDDRLKIVYGENMMCLFDKCALRYSAQIDAHLLAEHYNDQEINLTKKARGLLRMIDDKKTREKVRRAMGKQSEELIALMIESTKKAGADLLTMSMNHRGKPTFYIFSMVPSNCTVGDAPGTFDRPNSGQMRIRSLLEAVVPAEIVDIEMIGNILDDRRYNDVQAAL